MDSLLTVEDLAALLKVAPSTIYKWAHYEFIPHLKVGRTLRFEERAVQKWLKERENPGRTRLLPELDTIARD